jgi:hypothetical protein
MAPELSVLKTKILYVPKDNEGTTTLSREELINVIFPEVISVELTKTLGFVTNPVPLILI